MSRLVRLRLGHPIKPLQRSKSALITAALLALFVFLPVRALAQGSPFDTGFNAIQSLFTGTIAKVASLVAIVIGGYGFAHGEPGAKKALEDAIVEFVRRLVFSVVIGNADMHLKNWSLLYPDRRKPVLSPGYDFVATLPYIPNDKLALSFGGTRSLSEITPDQMRRFADTARIPASPLWRIAVETAERTVAAWKN